MKIQFVFSLIFYLTVLSLHSQIETRPIPRESINHFRLTTEERPAINIPFWDDFSGSLGKPDTSLWEFSQGVEVTQTLATNPPSLNSATMDGVDSLGNFYDNSNLFSGLTDELISRKIDLSSEVGNETIFLSFFWEAGGNVEIPEDDGDSLRLEFLNAENIWIRIWGTSAPLVSRYDQFKQEIFQITSEFLHEGFRFRFQTYGSQLGQFDSWHLDYIYLNKDRSIDNILYDDQAMTGSLSSLIKPYLEMPAEHFFSNPAAYIQPQSFQAYDLLEQASETAVTRFSLELFEATGRIDSLGFEDDGLTLSNPGLVNELVMDANPSTTPIDAVKIDPIFPSPDSVVFITNISSNFTDDRPQNDSLFNKRLFHNYYAYDDGTAEFAAGVSQNGSVLIEYIIPIADSLTHIDIFFSKIYPNPEGKTLEIQVWFSINDTDPVMTKTMTVSKLNTFTRVKLPSYVLVSDTVYIGYRQNSIDFLPIGLDRSNQTAREKMYYLLEGKWQPNQNANGIMMIRPVFEKVDNSVILGGQQPDFIMYPNPSTGEIQIHGKYEYLKVWSIEGRFISKVQNKSSHSIAHLPKGIYVVEIFTKSRTQRIKLIKE